MDGGIFFLIFLIVIAVIGFSIFHSKQVSEAWSEAARSLGLGYDAGGFGSSRKITGKHEGHVVVVDTFTRSHGKSSTTYTRYSVMHARPLGLGLNLRREGFFTGVAKAFGAQDIQIGDPAFDSLMLIKGADHQAVINFLTPERRNRIRQAFIELDRLEINDTGALLEVTGAASSSQQIVHVIRRLISLCQVMGDAPASVAAAAPVRTAPATLLVPAAAIAVPKPAPAPEPQPQPEPEPEPVLTPSEVAMVLFVGDASLAEIEQAFSANFAGLPVEGSGILRDWRPTGYDFDFGAGSCIKATVEVSLAERDSYGRKHAEVVVRLPADAKPAAIGKDFPFAGKLFKVDGLVRRLFIDACE